MNKSPYFKYILWVLVFFCNLSFSQTFKQSIKHYNLEDGLSQVTINDVIQDSSGFVWIATQDGLNRFDGKEFKHFKHNAADKTTISCNYLGKLLEDKTGKIWVGSNGHGGLSYYDQKKEIFNRVKLKYSDEPNEIISALAKDNSGAIWATSRISGLHKLVHIENDTFDKSSYFSDQPLSALLINNQFKMWVGHLNGSVFEFNSQSNLPANLLFKVKGQVRAFYKTNQQLLVGSDNGFYIYDFQSKNVELVKLQKNMFDTTQYVSAFLEAGESSVWIGTGSGLFLYDWRANRVLKTIKNSNNKSSGLSNNTVLSLVQLSSGSILIGTSNALNLLETQESFFNNISKDLEGKHLLNDNVTFSILKDSNDLWIGTSDGGLNLIRNNKAHYFLANQNNSTSITGNVVRAIVKDAKNQRLWLGTTRGLSMIDLKTFDPNNPKFTTFHHNPDDSNSINENFLKDLALDGNNNLWGATASRGIFRLELQNSKQVKITRYSNEKNNPNSLRNNFTKCLLIDKQNTIWVGTEQGLIELKYEASNYGKPIFTYYNETEDGDYSLTNNSVNDITIDKKNQLWVATHYGLNKFLGNNDFESWTVQKQFTNAVVYSVHDDDDGNLWLGTNQGMVKFDPENKIFAQYLKEDGIQSNEFDIHTKYKDTAGNIYLGGIGGVTYFHPTGLEKIDIPQNLYFSELLVKGNEIKVLDSTNTLLKEALRKTEFLEFKHDQFPFFLQFSSIDYRINKNVQYAYKLLQTDTEWTFLKEPEVQFLNLPAGSYTLQVNGFSRGKEWEQEPLKMGLKIFPPWWATWWAYLIYASVFLAIVYFFYHFQISRKLAIAESTRLKEINQLKNSLYDNITHEFRTPLTVVLGMTDSLENELQAKANPSINNAIEMIRRNGKSLLSLVNEMLDLSKLESGSMELNLVQTDAIPFVKYLSESFHSLAEAKKINLTVYSEIDALEMDIDVNKMASIMSNLLSNAIKFTSENGKIIVHLNKVETKDGAVFSIKVQDNGLGLAEDDIAHLFDRFYQVGNGSSQYQKGTGIGLSLAKEFVELMNGTIEVDSTLGKGSTFIVQIPVTNKAVKTVDAKITVEPPIKKTVPRTKTESSYFDEASSLPMALIIEDNEDVAHYLKTCLKGKYQTIHANNGNKGIVMAYEKIPDIIISDVMMPGKDGFEVCATLKSDGRTDHIPIILLTAKVTSEDRLVGLSHGADAYLAKPFNEKELFIRLDQLVLLRKKLVEKIQKDGLNTFLDKRAESPETKFLQKVIQFVNEDITNSDFGASDLANKLHLSESQVYRKLKAITDKSTAIFIRSIRLQNAKNLIETTDKTISEIAYETGFNDPSWFSRAFKEEFGFAPSDIHK